MTVRFAKPPLHVALHLPQFPTVQWGLEQAAAAEHSRDSCAPVNAEGMLKQISNVCIQGNCSPHQDEAHHHVSCVMQVDVLALVGAPENDGHAMVSPSWPRGFVQKPTLVAMPVPQGVSQLPQGVNSSFKLPFVIWQGVRPQDRRLSGRDAALHSALAASLGTKQRIGLSTAFVKNDDAYSHHSMQGVH